MQPRAQDPKLRRSHRNLPSRSRRAWVIPFQAAGRLVVASTSPPPGTAKAGHHPPALLRPVRGRKPNSSRRSWSSWRATRVADCHKSPLIWWLWWFLGSFTHAPTTGRDVTPKDNGRPASSRQVRYGHRRVPGSLTRRCLEFLARLPKLSLVACGVVLLPLYSLFN